MKVNISSDDEPPAFTNTQDSHDNGTMGDSHSDTDSNLDFDSVFDSDSNSSSKSHDDPDAPLDNEPESSASPDTKSDAGHNPGSSNELYTGSNPKSENNSIWQWCIRVNYF